MPEKERCRLWTRRLNEAKHRVQEAQEMIRDADMPDDDAERKNRMQAWAEVEDDMASAMLMLAERKHAEFCG